MCHHMFIAALRMGQNAIRAVLNPLLRITEVTAAFLSQGIKRTITEQTVEILCIVYLMAGIIGTAFVTEILRVVLFHFNLSLNELPV